MTGGSDVDASSAEHSSRTRYTASCYLLAILFGIAMMGGASTRSTSPAILFNPSESAPRGWYLLSPEAPTRVGQYAVARLPSSVARLAAARQYLPLGTLLLKSVAALRGDYVCADGAQVRVNRRTLARPLKEDAHKRALTAWRGCRLLSKGQYFLLSTTNPDSFDSRYFGPLDRPYIRGRAVPLWTWP